MAHGLIVRHTANYDIPQGLRITIGTDAQNQAVLSALETFSRA
jgi:histidinol-phosphate aminotransferase